MYRLHVSWSALTSSSSRRPAPVPPRNVTTPSPQRSPSRRSWSKHPTKPSSQNSGKDKASLSSKYVPSPPSRNSSRTDGSISIVSSPRYSLLGLRCRIRHHLPPPFHYALPLQHDTQWWVDCNARLILFILFLVPAVADGVVSFSHVFLGR